MSVKRESRMKMRRHEEAGMTESAKSTSLKTEANETQVNGFLARKENHTAFYRSMSKELEAAAMLPKTKREHFLSGYSSFRSWRWVVDVAEIFVSGSESGEKVSQCSLLRARDHSLRQTVFQLFSGSRVWGTDSVYEWPDSKRGGRLSYRLSGHSVSRLGLLLTMRRRRGKSVTKEREWMKTDWTADNNCETGLLSHSLFFLGKISMIIRRV